MSTTLDAFCGQRFASPLLLELVLDASPGGKALRWSYVSDPGQTGHKRPALPKMPATTRSQELKELTLYGVGNGFQTIVGVELLVDVVQMVA